MNITHGTTPDPAAAKSDTFEEVDVPAIQAEIQERRLDQLPPDNLFSREVAGQGTDDGVVDATVSEPNASTPGSKPPQVVETTPGRPGPSAPRQSGNAGHSG